MNQLATRSEFDALVAFALSTVAGSSARVYKRTYDLWADYCSNNAINPLAMKPANVLPFLETEYVTRKTRKRYMSAMRQLVKAYTIAEPDVGGRLYAALKMVKIPEGNLNPVERNRKALSPSDVHQLLTVWDSTSLLGIRNQAIVAVLFLTAVRRAELASLMWTDVNLEDYVIRIRYGKGGKEREVAIAGEAAVNALKRLRGAFPEYAYVFPTFDVRQQVKGDVPIDGQTVYRVIKRTERLTGITFTPHTARRTFITEGLAQGTPLADMQAQAGHSKGETTLTYARPLDAKARRKTFRHRYGD